MSALDIFGASSDSLLQMLQDLHFDANVQNNIVMKASNIAIRCPTTFIAGTISNGHAQTY